MNIKTIVTVASLMFSLGVIAQDDWVKTQTVTAHGLDAGAETSAILKNLSPAAIELGLRDTQMLAEVSINKKTNVLNYHWHSLVKDINGTTYAQALSEPLSSEAKIADGIESVDAGIELVAKGDIDSLLSDFQKLLAKAEETTEIEENSTLNQETVNENASGNSSSTGGGALGGESGGLTENPESGDLEVELDQVIEKVEACSMKVDLTNMIVSEQERIIKTLSSTGEVVETTECKNVGQAFPIRKDFQAGCEVKVDKASGEYIKGFKLYAMVDGSRYDISECEWEDADSIAFDVMRDLDACSIDKAVVNADRGIYYPAFVEYTNIDGKRFDLSDCKTSENVVKELPTKVEMCENYNDYASMTSFEQSRTDTYDPDFKKVLLSTNCSNNGTSYPIEKDFEVSYCDVLPNYMDEVAHLGFQHFYTKDGKKVYIGNCQNDFDNPLALTQETGNCRATENLVDNEATVNKRWFYNDPQTEEQVFITDCVASDEVYPIVTTQESCSPEFLSDINKVILKEREGWQDAQGSWNFVTECRATSTEVAVETEVCDSPKYEHDYVGGTSYLRTRDYYVHNGERQYINACSRDSSVSFPHFKDATGCSVQHDDANLRSRMYSKTMANLEEGKTQLKSCEPESSYVPYQFTGVWENKKHTKVLETGDSSFVISDRYTISQLCGMLPIASKYGQNFSYPSGQSASTRMTRQLSVSQTGIFKQWITAYLNVSVKEWSRVDNSKYFQYLTYQCSK